jgi:beta-phosphoglucomutase
MSLWPRAVLFDFDGVIVNSEPLHFRAFRNVLADEKIELSEEEYYRELIGFDDAGAFRHIFALRGRALPPRTFLRLMARKSRAMMDLIHRESYQALPGADEFIRGLWWNYPLAICSGAVREEIEVMLEGISLRDCFGVITSSEDVRRGKPDPEGYLLTMRNVSQRLRDEPLSPGDCLVIEDAPSVIELVKKKGFAVLGVSSSFFADKLASAGADWVVRSLDVEEIRRIIPDLKIGV